jgi:hypothetical protein
VVGGGAACALAAVALGVVFSRLRGLRIRERVGALPHPHLRRQTALSESARAA